MFRLAVSSGLIAVVMVPVSGAPVPKAEPQPVYYFPTAVGAVQVYRVSGEPNRKAWHHTFTVTSVEVKDGTTLIKTKREVGGATVTVPPVTVSKDGLFDSGDRERPFAPPLPLLKAPPKAGESWEWSGTYGRQERTQTRRVAGVEAVEVPAGKYEAVRVEFSEGRAGLNHVFQSTEWHAPGVGRVKCKSNNLVEELVSFTPGNGTPAKK